MGAGHIQTRNTPSKQVATDEGAEQSQQKKGVKGKGKWTANSMIGGHLLISFAASPITLTMCLTNVLSLERLLILSTW